MIKERLQTIEVYDSFRDKVLLEVKFARVGVSEPVQVRTFRSSYYSIRELFNGALTHYEQMELKINGHNHHIDGTHNYNNLHLEGNYDIQKKMVHNQIPVKRSSFQVLILEI